MTRIESRYSTHTLTWCCGKYKQTFPTPVSGIPQLMFDEGFTKYKIYCAKLVSPLPQSAHATIEYEDGEIQTDNMLVMMNESIKLNDGNGKMIQQLILVQFYMQKFSSIKPDDHVTQTTSLIESISHITQYQTMQTFPFWSNNMHLRFITSHLRSSAIFPIQKLWITNTGI